MVLRLEWWTRREITGNEFTHAELPERDCVFLNYDIHAKPLVYIPDVLSRVPP